MGQLKGAIRNGNRLLRDVAQEVIESADDYFIWRHQLTGRQNPDANNVMGEDPDGFYWDTRDLVIPAKREGPDDMGKHLFYCQVEPVYNDLFISVLGQPQTQAQVRNAPRGQVYRVCDFDVRRDSEERVISAKVWAKPDRSGKWGRPS